jgi:hypothetical protein
MTRKNLLRNKKNFCKKIYPVLTGAAAISNILGNSQNIGRAIQKLTGDLPLVNYLKPVLVLHFRRFYGALKFFGTDFFFNTMPKNFL